MPEGGDGKQRRVRGGRAARSGGRAATWEEEAHSTATSAEMRSRSRIVEGEEERRWVLLTW